MCSSLFDWFLCHHYRLINYFINVIFTLISKIVTPSNYDNRENTHTEAHISTERCVLFISSMQRQVKQLLHVPVFGSSYQLGKWILLMAYWQSSSLFFAWNTKPKPPLPKHSSCSKSDRYLWENTSNNFIIILLFFHVDYNDTNNTGNIIIFLRNCKCQD